MKFPVSEAKWLDLVNRMEKLKLKESDWVEEFVKGAGSGGQKINKTSMAVWLKHLPTGIEVKCQASRKQSLNRFLARRLMVEKLESLQDEFVEKQKSLIEKIRRQKQKRTKRAKQKILDQKKIQSTRKETRKKPEDEK